jgi:hypothetical protein
VIFFLHPNNTTMSVSGWLLFTVLASVAWYALFLAGSFALKRKDAVEEGFETSPSPPPAPPPRTPKLGPEEAVAVVAAFKRVHDRVPSETEVKDVAADMAAHDAKVTPEVFLLRRALKDCRAAAAERAAKEEAATQEGDPAPQYEAPPPAPPRPDRAPSAGDVLVEGFYSPWE